MAKKLTYVGLGSLDGNTFNRVALTDANMAPLATLWMLATIRPQMLTSANVAQLSDQLNLDPAVIDRVIKECKVASVANELTAVAKEFHNLATIGNYPQGQLCPMDDSHFHDLYAAAAKVTP